MNDESSDDFPVIGRRSTEDTVVKEVRYGMFSMVEFFSSLAVRRYSVAEERGFKRAV